MKRTASRATDASKPTDWNVATTSSMSYSGGSPSSSRFAACDSTVNGLPTGDTLISPQLTVRLLRQLSVPAGDATEATEPLTPREREIVHMVAAGGTNAEIGAAAVHRPRHGQ